MAKRPFDLQLIPEFGGTTLDESIIEWLERVEMICELADEEMVEHILPLRLTSEVLVDTFVAFEQFVTWRLCDGETVDEFLATFYFLLA